MRILYQGKTFAESTHGLGMAGVQGLEARKRESLVTNRFKLR
jgi:hypothetical protein